MRLKGAPQKSRARSAAFLLREFEKFSERCIRVPRRTPSDAHFWHSALSLACCLALWPFFGYVKIRPATGPLGRNRNQHHILLCHRIAAAGGGEKRSYHIKANSAAAKALISIYVSETVEMIVEGPPRGVVEVVSIVRQQGS